MKKAHLPGIIKYGSIKQALRDVAKKVEEKHYELLRGEVRK